MLCTGEVTADEHDLYYRKYMKPYSDSEITDMINFGRRQQAKLGVALKHDFNQILSGELCPAMSLNVASIKAKARSMFQRFVSAHSLTQLSND